MPARLKFQTLVSGGKGFASGQRRSSDFVRKSPNRLLGPGGLVNSLDQLEDDEVVVIEVLGCPVKKITGEHDRNGAPP